MLKRYRFWLVLAIGFLFLTALVHASAFLLEPAPQNETERQLFELMSSFFICLLISFALMPRQVAANP